MKLRSAAVTTALILTVASTAAAQSAQDVLWDAAIAGDTAAIRQAVADGAVIDSLDVKGGSIEGPREPVKGPSAHADTRPSTRPTANVVASSNLAIIEFGPE